jgi:hypothetical protein
MDNDHYLIKRLQNDTSIANKIQSNLSSSTHDELRSKIDTLSAIVIALAKMMELKGLASMSEINALLSTMEQMDENDDGTVNYKDALKTFGFNQAEIDELRKIKSIRMAKRNREFRASRDRLI